MQRNDSMEKTLMLGRIEGRRKRGWQRVRWLDGITGGCHWMRGWMVDGHEFEQAPGVGDGQGCLHAAVHGVAKCWTRLSSWTDAEAETPILQPPDVKNQLTGKFPNAGKDEGRKMLTEHGLVRWHHFSMDMSLNKVQETVQDREA